MLEVKEPPKAKAEVPQGEAKVATSLSVADARSGEKLARRNSPLALRAGSPFAFIRRFAEEMDRLFEDFGVERGLHVPSFITRGHELLRREAGLVEADWSPQVDVKEQDGRLLVRADLPGLTKNDVKVELTDDTLTIRGERKEEKKEKREGYSYSECSYGSFYRAIPLPEGVDASKATAEFRNGVLEIALPSTRRPEPQARRLEIQEKK
ncbi:Hsp20/alpha crystallin family protein [Paludisphaera borealis]|uniref:Spore protein SP21 n=1 Tax=Paludisphaera borealis TaxID=1387353 RepID=A0A1U7CNP1_9BACT|nr:Hsp20/alpha crystallin family protein [Paludisphaera borealis]APW60547.1 Spore protein SP21 [Paludisphaera borealis]